MKNSEAFRAIVTTGLVVGVLVISSSFVIWWQRGGNVQNTDDETGSDDCAKRLGILHAIVTELTQKTRKSESKETIAAGMDQLMEICNLRCNGREATARISDLWTFIRRAEQQDIHFDRFRVFLHSRFVVISWTRCPHPFEF